MRTLILDAGGGWLSAALSEFPRGVPDPSHVFCATEAEAEEALRQSSEDGCAVFIHARPDDDNARGGAASASLNLMLAGPAAGYPRIVIYGFEGPGRFGERSRRGLGVDVLTLPGVQFVRLPALADALRRTRDEMRAAGLLDGEAVEAELSGVRRRLLTELWADFGHDCGNLQQTEQGWRRFKGRLLPTFEANALRFEHPTLGTYVQARQELRGIAAAEFQSFDRLYAHLSKVNGGGATALAPRAAASAVAGAKQAPGAFASALKGNVMLVEDDEEFAADVKGTLEAAGHEVTLVTDVSAGPEQIIKKISRNRVTVLLLDLNFGSVEKGFAILGEVKRRHRDVKVAMLTGYSDRRSMVRAKALGAERFLRKGVDKPADIVQAVSWLLAERRVLLIDDNVRELTTPDFMASFETNRCLVLTYDDPDEALGALSGKKFKPEDLHLVLLDLKFGDSIERGYDAFKRIKSLRRDLPVFILTGYDSEEVIHNVTYGVLDHHFAPPRDDFIVKPLSEEGWAAIWAALFPDPEELGLSIKGQMVRLLRADGGTLAEAKLRRKEFLLLLALAYKRQSGTMTELLSLGWDNPLGQADEEMNKASRALKVTYGWTGKEIAHSSFWLNKFAKKRLGFEGELVTTTPYILNTRIKRVIVEP